MIEGDALGWSRMLALVTPPNGQTWTVERLQGEPDAAWAAFQTFLRMGLPTAEGVPKREMAPIAKALGINPHTLQHYREHWNWLARAAVVDQRIQEAWIGAACSAGQDCASAISILAARIRTEAEAMILTPGPLFLDANGRPDLSALVKAVDTIAKLDRLISGKSTANVAVQAAIVENLDALPLESPDGIDLETLDKIRRKTQGG